MAHNLTRRPASAPGQLKAITVDVEDSSKLTFGSDVEGATATVERDQDGNVTVREVLPDGSEGETLLLSVTVPESD